MDYIVHLLSFIAIYSILAMSLDLVLGHGGFLSVAHGGLFGVGAYTTAILSTRYNDLDIVLIALIAFGLGVASSICVSGPAARLRGDYFVIASFGIQMVFYSIFKNWNELTGGPIGISGIPRPTILGFEIDSKVGAFALFFLFSLVVFFLRHLVVNSPFGRALRSARDDETLARSLGKNIFYLKSFVFATSSGCAALSGVLYAYHVSFIDPESFTVMESVFIISMVITGGSGSRWGAVLGTVVVVLIPEALRFAEFSNSTAASMRQIFYGVCLVLVMIFRPAGLAGDFQLK